MIIFLTKTGLIRVYEKGLMVRLSGVRMTIGEMGISELETFIIMYNALCSLPGVYLCIL